MAKVPVNKHQPVYQMPTSPLAVKTKKFALDKKDIEIGDPLECD